MRGYKCSFSVRRIQSLNMKSCLGLSAVLQLLFTIHPNLPHCKFWVDLQANIVFQIFSGMS